MHNLLSVAFEAHNPLQNHHRRYRLTIGRDLFDDWVVAIGYGRVGKGGQELQYSSRNPDELRSVIRNCLSRRLSAPHRIGCHYRLAAFSAGSSFDVPFWLPEEILSRFRALSDELTNA